MADIVQFWRQIAESTSATDEADAVGRFVQAVRQAETSFSISVADAGGTAIPVADAAANPETILVTLDIPSGQNVPQWAPRDRENFLALLQE